MTLFPNIRQQSQNYWQALKPRQRKLLASATGILIVTLAYILVIAPWIIWQRKLDNSLPQLRADLAKMQQLAEQSRSLSPIAKSESDASELLPDLQREFTPPNPSSPPPVVHQNGQNRIQLSLGQADFDTTLAHIAYIQKKHSLTLTSAKFTKRDSTSDAVEAEIIFERPSRQ